MQNRVPMKVEDRPPLPDFTPVPRKFRHDGWTPERQKAFIEALADTGSVSRAAAMVNMAQANCYTLRRAAGAEEFRRAWEAALDFGVQRLKDIAFERAIDGQLIPVFVGGKLLGFRRKRNDALLMFCLRHYGQTPEGRHTTINYFSTRASAGAGAGPSTSLGTNGERVAAAAEASTTTMRTVIKGPSTGLRTGPSTSLGTNPSTGLRTSGEGAGTDQAAAVMNGFDGVVLDAQAQAAIAAALEDCAARARAFEAATDWNSPNAIDAQADDPDTSFIRVGEGKFPFVGELESGLELEPEPVFEPEGESHWRLAGAELLKEHADWLDAQEAAALTAREAEAAPKIAEIRKRPSKRKKTAG